MPKIRLIRTVLKLHNLNIRHEFGYTIKIIKRLYLANLYILTLSLTLYLVIVKKNYKIKKKLILVNTITGRIVIAA
jgi:hypothetical protein